MWMIDLAMSCLWLLAALRSRSPCMELRVRRSCKRGLNVDNCCTCCTLPHNIHGDEVLPVHAAGPQANHVSRIWRGFRVWRVVCRHMRTNARDTTVRRDAVLGRTRHHSWRVHRTGPASTWRRQLDNYWNGLALQRHLSLRQDERGSNAIVRHISKNNCVILFLCLRQK